MRCSTHIKCENFNTCPADAPVLVEGLSLNGGVGVNLGQPLLETSLLALGLNDSLSEVMVNTTCVEAHRVETKDATIQIGIGASCPKKNITYGCDGGLGMEKDTPFLRGTVKRNPIPAYIGNIHKIDMQVLLDGSFTIGEYLTKMVSRKRWSNNS